MPSTRSAAGWAVAAAAAMIASLGLHSPASASSGDPGQPQAASNHRGGDIRDLGPNAYDGKTHRFDDSLRAARKQARLRATGATAADAQVGDVKKWLYNDDYNGAIGVEDYTLKGIGNHIEVWVANDRAFPDGDCRNALNLTDITDAQVSSFIHEFDTNIYPKEAKNFSIPPNEDGADAPLPGLIGQPDDYYQVDSSQADDIVVLVDNVKDANYYHPETPDGQTYIAGFFYSLFNQYTNRNIMTIDAYDWLHRTGANPPDDSRKPAYKACKFASGAPRPHLYEGTFAHEYQHLLEYYQDPDEVNWVNEGLSDWAQSLVGYVNTELDPANPLADSHISCFQGFLDPAFGGAENSLTQWGDQGGPEILCDYGAAYSFMSYLHGHYGTGFMSALHRNPGNGFQGLNDVFHARHIHETALDAVHKWAATMALDKAISKIHAKLVGGKLSTYRSTDLNSRINWGNKQDFNTPGAPPNGSDYVRFRDHSGNFLNAKSLRHIHFQGAKALAPKPMEWKVDPTPPTATTTDTSCTKIPAGAAPEALYSGCGDNLDRSMVRKVHVPDGGAALTFDALWNTEDGWDFGFAQVSADGGRTWHSLATADTTTAHDPGAIPGVVSNLPGFTGDGGSWKAESADLTPYAGKDVLVGFRYITDPGTTYAGFWVRNIHVGSTELPAQLSGWETITKAYPVRVHGWTVQLLAYNSHGRAWIKSLHLNGSFSGDIRHKKLKKVLGQKGSVAAALVMFNDPSETADEYAKYKLTVDGVTQPGGGR